MHPITVGVIGGGQLCRMMGEEIVRKKLPFELVTLDPTEGCPAAPFAKKQIVADFKDSKAIRELAEQSDVMTYEIELAGYETLHELENMGKKVHPSSHTLQIVQDKFRQKSFLQSRGLPVPDFREVASSESIVRAAEWFGYPLMLKARTDSYDGRGNYLIKDSREIDTALAHFNGRRLMVEQYIEFDKEVSVIAARGTNGEIRTYPVGENIHEDNILRTTIVPARMDKATAQKAEALAAKTLKELRGAGVFGIEMFVRAGEVMINEIAPRVHNSGHYTIEACPTSQFEQHLRAITGMPLGSTELLRPAVMVNILGPQGYSGLYEVDMKEAGFFRGVHMHTYGKKTTSPKRKLGHLTVLGNQDAPLEDVVARAQAMESTIRIKRLQEMKA
ncbi:MAG: 5-(carboxyamino)imidazole ribonucleotide synthase [Candidatus Aenigmatarchaeota archaeon]|nr:MAG: 5-(carboxyamino)imidazole ribonucleotide synthase [Candidatus Aenigmarchaeota archaeon]